MKNYDAFVLVDYVTADFEYLQTDTNILGVYSSFDKALDAMTKLDLVNYYAGGNRHHIHGDTLKYYEGRLVGRDFWNTENIEHKIRVVAFEMDKEVW